MNISDFLLVGGKNLKSDSFTSSGTWTNPGSTLAYILMCGAGGGGGGSTSSGGGGGGGGESILFQPFPLVSNENIDVVIGAGGTGAIASSNTEGGDGGNTSITSSLDSTRKIIAYGGKGGRRFWYANTLSTNTNGCGGSIYGQYPSSNDLASTLSIEVKSPLTATFGLLQATNSDYRIGFEIFAGTPGRYLKYNQGTNAKYIYTTPSVGRYSGYRLGGSGGGGTGENNPDAVMSDVIYRAGAPNPFSSLAGGVCASVSSYVGGGGAGGLFGTGGNGGNSSVGGTGGYGAGGGGGYMNQNGGAGGSGKVVIYYFE